MTVFFGSCSHSPVKDEVYTEPLFDQTKCEPMSYPAESIQRDEQGSATVKMYVSTSGAVENISIEKSSGYPKLDDATLKFYSGCIFTPATRNGAPVGTWKQVTFTWKIDKS